MLRLFVSLLLAAPSVCNAVLSPISDNDFVRELFAVRAALLLPPPAVIAPGDRSAAAPDISDLARRVAGLVSPDPEGIDSLFDPSFLEQVPAESLKSVFVQFYKDHGRVSSVIPLGQDTGVSGSFRFIYEKGTEMRVEMSVSPLSPAKITGLMFRPASATANYRSIGEVVEEISKLSGTSGFMLAEIGQEFKVLYQLNPDAPLALGSTFKLYVLAALSEVGMPWDKILTIREDWKSLPSGILHTWAAGSPITVRALAEKMISISDNTATDHLLYSIGRERVEGMLSMFGNSRPKLSIPFLSTLEMFKLKSYPEMLTRYLAGDTAMRRSLLENEIRLIPRDQIQGWSLPVAVDSTEWFASPLDICRLMNYLYVKNDRTVLEIMSVNPGLSIPKTFSYAGYKGGSEPGVLNMSWLLKTRDGRVYALSAGWNNSSQVVDTKRFAGLLQAVIDILGESAVPEKSL